MLVTCQIMQYKVSKLSDYTAVGTVRTRSVDVGGKHENSYNTWYKNRINWNLGVAMMQRNWFSLSFAWNFQQSF